MNPSDFVYVIYEGKLFVASKVRWNKKNGYVPSDFEASQEAEAFLKSISPDFRIEAESCFKLNGSAKKGAKLLKEKGVREVNFGEIV